MTAKKKKSTGRAKPDSVYQLKVALLESEQPIWRRLQVPGKVTLGELHYVLQAVMGWTNSHLHQFTVDKVDYSDPEFELEEAEDEYEVTLSQIAPRAGSVLVYQYDFGDSWMHEIRVEKILPPEPGQGYPVCLAGERACPPEDCGGVWGYEEFLEAIRNPEHEEHEDLLDWIGGSFDPEAFDLNEVNRELKGIRRVFR